MHKSELNLASMWREEFRFSDTQHSHGKPLVRPDMVESVGIHDTYILSKGMKEMDLSPEGIFIIHARDSKVKMHLTLPL
jgi:hypothetical protein